MDSFNAEQENSPAMIDPALADRILCDKRRFLVNPCGYDFNIVLTGKRPSPCSEELYGAVKILSENYCADEAATHIIRQVLHLLASVSGNIDIASPFSVQFLEIVRMWLVLNQPALSLEPKLTNSTKERLHLKVSNYIRAIENNTLISGEISLVLLNFWSSVQIFCFDLINPRDLAFVAFSVIDNMRYPGMVMPQLHLLATLADLLVFPNTPALRFMLANAILTK